jgi:hypothetical protein
MLKTLKESPTVGTKFVVLDIENYPNGDVITIDVCWREDRQKVHRLFHNWKTFWNWIVTKSRNDERFRVLYAHNGGGWDWLSLVDYLLHDGKRKHQIVTGIIAASKLVTMTVQIRKKQTIHFCDSLQLLRSKLEILAKKFGVTNKINLGDKLPHEIYQTNRELYFQYVKADTESLLEVLEKSLEILNTHVAKIGDFGYTIGSTAMKVFRTMLTQEIAVPYDSTVKQFLRNGYKGGRVEVFKVGTFPDITVFDVNSLYPYAMLTTAVPVSDRGVWTDTFDPGLSGCYNIRFRQNDTSIPAILMVGGLGAYTGEGTYFSPEIALLKECDPKAEIEIVSGYVFLDSAKLFQDYVNRLYSLRLQDKDGPISLMAKFLLNSLYGKFAQNPVRTKIVEVPNFDDLYALCEDGADITPINDELGVYGIKTEHAAAFEHVGIAGMITSQARVILYKGILNAGINNVVYCDTDSVHVSGLCSLPISDKIGGWKKEFEGEGTYVGKKLYALRRPLWYSIGKQWECKIRAKGITVSGRNGSDIRYSDFVRLTEKGETYKANYTQPATAKQVFNGDKPCCFQPRSRTIRRIIK